MADENDSGSGNLTNKGRFANITNQQPNKIVEGNEALNTNRSTKQVVRLSRKY
jgi:hypothetical protein